MDNNMTVAQDIFALRKEHRFDEALKKARESFAVTPDDFYLQQAYGWVLFDFIKKDVKSFEASEKSASQLGIAFTNLLREYAKLDNIERPGLLHSQMLTQVLKGNKAWPNFLAFAKWWNPAVLREEDCTPYKTEDGNTIPSLQMRLAYAIGRAILDFPEGGKDDIREWAEGFLRVTLAANPNDQWLNYYKSKLLLKQGRAREAREHLFPVVIRQKRTGWSWSLLGQTYESDDPEKAIICYYYAIHAASKPEEVLKTRESLAKLLAANQRFPEAARQIHVAIDFREEHQYRIPADLAQLCDTGWFRKLPRKEDLPHEPDVREAAELLLYGSDNNGIITQTGVIDHHNPEKALAYVVFSITEGIALPYKKFKDVHRMPVGTFVEVRLLGNPPQAIRVSTSDASVIDGFCIKHEGLFSKRPEQAFGFIDAKNGERVFIPPVIVASADQALSGVVCECLAVLSKDRKRGSVGWKALTLSQKNL